MNPVDIVIPVYDGLEETRCCLESVLATTAYDWARPVVINDCSPNPEITAMLRRIAEQQPGLVLLENESNRGFVATANRGMGHDRERDVLLLNSDVEVAGDWLVRLREAAYLGERIGSLTPFSNNATICSFPNFCKDNPLAFGLDVAALDGLFASKFGPRDQFEVPTGIGFCMYIRRDCLEAVGDFDEETFGRGYGEENDWCQRAAAAGWHNYHQANCFVYHKGGVSFGAEHNPRVSRAMELVDAKHPRYHADVQAYIATDPARNARTEALLELFARQTRPKIAFVSHKLGGGAQQHVNELASLYDGEALCLQITPDVDGQSVIVALFDGGERLQDGLYLDVERDYDKLLALLVELGVGRVHFHHTMGLHPRLWRLAVDLGCEYDLTIHDFHLINGNPTLTDRSARYVEEGSPDFDQRCAGHYPLPEGVTADMWRDNQRPLVEGADRVIFPSGDCRARFRQFFDVRNPVAAWHPDYRASQPYPNPAWRVRTERPLRVLVLGAISREKGADVLEEVARATSKDEVEFHLLGYAYRALEGGVVTHGPYRNESVYRLVQEIDPDVVWYPALWPETYSYTLSVALHMGLPVVVPDIGAFVERVSGRAQSAVCPWNRSVAEWAAFWRELSGSGDGLPAGPERPGDGAADADQPGRDYYVTEYLRPVPARAGELNSSTLAGLAGNFRAGLPELSTRERLLERIWKFSRRPAVARLVSVVPFKLQRAIKRRLSARPMHDIVRED